MIHNRRISPSLRKEAKALEAVGFKVEIHPPRKFIPGIKNKWLADLLKIIGRSQERFGAMVGVSRDVVANIKDGRSRLSKELAQKIYVATGAYHIPYLRGDDRVLAIDGRPYTRAAFDYWRNRFGDSDEKRLNDFYQFASDSLFLLLTAAGKYKLANHLPALRQSFLDWCNQSYRNFKLEKPVEEILKERKFVSELKMTYHDWRRPEMAGYRELYGFKEDAKRRDDELLTLKTVLWPLWSACSNMKRDDTSRHMVVS